MIKNNIFFIILTEAYDKPSIAENKYLCLIYMLKTCFETVVGSNQYILLDLAKIKKIYQIHKFYNSCTTIFYEHSQ